MNTSFEYSFPSIRGVQAGREYYVSMCPLKLIPKIFLFNESELPPEVRAQRILNKARIPAIAKYLLDNQNNYVFSALTASVDSQVKFDPIGETGEANRLGVLRIPMTAQFIINDGQHRRAAIEIALKENPALGDETVAIVFFLDYGLERCQQMFADLNRYAVRPSTSISILYDHRDDLARTVRLVVLNSHLFKEVVEMERTTLSLRSKELITLSAIFTASKELIKNIDYEDNNAIYKTIELFWEEIASYFPEWMLVKDRKITAGQVREKFLHSHGVVLQALGRVGNTVLHANPETWKDHLRGLSEIDWTRDNAEMWEGRALLGGKVSKSATNVILTANIIKIKLGLMLTQEEENIEKEARRGNQ